MAGYAGHDLLRAALGGDSDDDAGFAERGFGAPPKYMFNGVAYNSLDEVRAAMQGGGAPQACGRGDSSGTLKRIEAILGDQNQMDAMVGQLFRTYAGSDGRLQPGEMKGLADILSIKIGIDRSFFENIDAMFYRFDFDGDSQLDLKECNKLIKFLLKEQRRLLNPVKEHTLTHLARKNLKQYFDVGKKLGQGGQGAIYLAKDKQTGTMRVCKFYDKSGGNSCLEDIKDEFELLKKLDHPNIANICEVFEDNANIYVISSPYTGGDLCTCTQKGTAAGVQITHVWLGLIFLQVIEAISYLHSQRTMHCDIKEPNVMIADDQNWQRPHVVVIDFGMAKSFSGMRAGGTPGYMPPEFWTHQLWTPKGDMFALAVTFWSIYNGRQGGPFQVADAGPPFPNTQRATITAPMDCSQFPPGLRELMQKMSAKDFRRRPTAKQALRSSYFDKLSEAEERQPIDKAMISGMMKAASKSASQNMIALELANTRNLAQMKDLNNLFRQLDADDDGKVEYDESLKILCERGFPREEAKKIVDALVGDDGAIQYSEFMGRMIASTEALDSSTLAEVFQSIDTDGSGSLDLREIGQLMSHHGMEGLLEGRSPEDLLREMDINGDGQVSFSEFRQTMLGNGPPSSSYAEGDNVEYFSPSNQKWVPCKLTGVDSKGRVQISVKPGAWLDAHTQTAQLRKA